MHRLKDFNLIGLRCLGTKILTRFVVDRPVLATISVLVKTVGGGTANPVIAIKTCSTIDDWR
jgi:hypothetical protein